MIFVTFWGLDRSKTNIFFFVLKIRKCSRDERLQKKNAKELRTSREPKGWRMAQRGLSARAHRGSVSQPVRQLCFLFYQMTVWQKNMVVVQAMWSFGHYPPPPVRDWFLAQTPPPLGGSAESHKSDLVPKALKIFYDFFSILPWIPEWLTCFLKRSD